MSKGKIVHVCLAGSYNDGWSYHDNLLSQYHKQLGYNVTLVTTAFVNAINSDKYEYYKTGTYVNEFGIKIIRIPLKFFKKSKLIMKLRMYSGTYETLSKEKPDIIFVHCSQFWDIRKVLKYKRKNPNVRLYIDNHADYSNSAKNWVSYHLLHKLLWKSGIKKCIPYAEKFYGVLPARVDFLNEMYGVPRNKIELLVMGADDKFVNKARTEESKKRFREKYNISRDDFLIVTGGKIDAAKWQIFNLLEYVTNSNKSGLKLIVFGPIVDEMREKVLKYIDGTKIQYNSWIDAEESYGLFAIANLAVFPGRHSVYWEQAVGCGTPIMVKYWEGVTHVDLQGNCLFLKLDTVKELGDKIDYLISNDTEYEKMRAVAEEKGISHFSYLSIAKRSIDDVD